MKHRGGFNSIEDFQSIVILIVKSQSITILIINFPSMAKSIVKIIAKSIVIFRAAEISLRYALLY